MHITKVWLFKFICVTHRKRDFFCRWLLCVYASLCPSRTPGFSKSIFMHSTVLPREGCHSSTPSLSERVAIGLQEWRKDGRCWTTYHKTFLPKKREYLAKQKRCLYDWHVLWLSCQIELCTSLFCREFLLNFKLSCWVIVGSAASFFPFKMHFNFYKLFSRKFSKSLLKTEVFTWAVDVQRLGRMQRPRRLTSS